MKAAGFRLAFGLVAAVSALVTYISFSAFAFLHVIQTGDPPNVALAIKQATSGKIGSIAAIITIASSAALFKAKWISKIIAIAHACISGLLAVSMALSWFTIWFGRQ